MKKFFILALGALLLVAFTAPVMAETKIEFSGNYRVRYHMIWNRNVHNDGDQQSYSSAFDHRLRLEPSFVVSDNLRMVTRLTGLSNNRWGANNATNYTPVVPNSAYNDGDIQIERAYMQIGSPYGTFRVGRMSGGVAGLQALGYTGSRFYETTGVTGTGTMEVFDSEGPTHRLWYASPRFGNFQILAVYQKSAENDWTNTGAGGAPGWDDDIDNFGLLPRYDWSFGSANMLLWYVRDRDGGLTGNDADTYIINPAVLMNFGNFSTHLEGRYSFGTTYDGVAPGTDMKNSGLGLYGDVQYNWGPGTVGAFAIYLTGDDNPADDKNKAAVNTGADFSPFLIAYDYGLYDGNAAYNAVGGLAGAANHLTIGAWTDYNVTEDLMLYAAVGYMTLNEEVAAGIAKDYGFEVDVAATYKIMDGLRFTTIGGYFIPGKFHEDFSGRSTAGAFAWKNQLQIDF